MSEEIRVYTFVKDLLAIKTRHLITIQPDSSLTNAIQVLAQNNIRRLPVVDESGKLVGIITDRDLRLATNSPFQKQSLDEAMKDLSKHKVSDIMERSVITVEADDTIVAAAKIIRVRKVGGVPVTNSDGQLVGVLSRTDLLDHLIRLIEPYTPSDDDDEPIPSESLRNIETTTLPPHRA